jgi:GNAT superfamily N-acetyltransferase
LINERNTVSANIESTAQAVREALHEDEVRRCWPVFEALRPQLDETEFLRRWRLQREEGYRIAFIEADGALVAAAGFRLMHTMAWGKILYLDDLGALPGQQGRGWGSALLVWLQAEARRLQCEAVHLDTGYHRHAAHKAYLRNGFTLNCHHLAWKAA